MKILLVEDEPKVSAFIQRGLEEQGYEVKAAFDGQMGLTLAMRGGFDLILLDLLIPYVNGLEICRQMRNSGNQVPILMLTALGTTEDKLLGFEAGADDYLVKPFEFKELLARIRVLTKRVGSVHQSSNTLRIADLELDLDEKIAIRGSKKISLTAKEFALLEYFMRNKGKVVSRLDISENVWDIDFDTGTNVVDVYVNILRKKVDKDFPNKLIHTRIGMGYIFNED
jgi:DNA-binding response OmpR family regulator